MASRQEKEKFFVDLDALDTLSSEDDESKKRRHFRHPLSRHQATTQPQPNNGSELRRVSKPPVMKRTSSEPSTADNNKKMRLRKNAKSISKVDQIFQGQTFIFVPNSNVSMLRKRRIDKAIEHGAVWAKSWSSEVTHIIVDNELQMKDVTRITGQENLPATISLVNLKWFTESLGFNERRVESASRFQVPGGFQGEQMKLANTSREIESPDYGDVSQKSSIPNPIDDSSDTGRMTDELDEMIDEAKATFDLPLDIDDVTSQNSFVDSETSEDPLPSLSTIKGFQCMEKNDGQPNANPNARTIEILQKMASYYDRIGDNWRILAYRKAVTALRKQPTRVETKEQAIAIPQIGEHLALKIQEIVTTDRLQRLDSTTATPNERVLQLFMGIYQVGNPTATRWVAQGYRTLEDLLSKAPLSPNQRIGIEHYHDFLTRIPRAEVAEHASIVEKALRKADPGLRLIIGGSYRRGTTDSGDIDLILTKENASIEHVRTLLMDTVVPQLKKSGFLKATLATSTTRDEGSKWHGASALPGSELWRRIDLLFVPWNELGAALLYFTGNDIFNRSMRLLASRKGMRLNQHGLYTDIMRGEKRQRITEGRLLEGQSEKKIFEILGIPWRPPEHRRV